MVRQIAWMDEMSKIIAEVRRFFLLVFGVDRREPAQIPEKIEAGQPSLAKKDEELSDGLWRAFQLKDLLEKLNFYLEDMRLLRKTFPDAYEFFSRVGGTVIASHTLMHSQQVDYGTPEPNKLPSWMLCFFNRAEEHQEKVFASLWAARKTKWFPGLQPSNGVIYEMTVVYRMNSKIQIPISFHISVTEAGVCVLKEREDTCQNLPRGGHVMHYRYQVPRGLRSIYAESEAKKNGETLTQFVSKIFHILVNAAQSAAGGLRVTCRKAGIAASFGIPMLDTPKFFADRDLVVDQNGKRKKIIHIVRTHERQTWRGTQYVKSHFRGLRRFSWNGFDVAVSMPGKHHADLSEFAAETLTLDPDEVKAHGREVVTARAFGRAISDSIFGKAA